MEVEINYWAVLIAGVSSMIVGAIWYAPSVFGKAWMKLAKVDPKKDAKTSAQTGIMFGLTFVASLVTAYVVAHVAYISHRFFSMDFMEAALSTAFWLWLGLIAVRFLVHDLFEGRPTKLTLLTMGNELATVVVMALVIGLMGV